jgi:type IV pilus assembly protein PilC
MLSFKYEARNPVTGEKISAAIDADSEQAAASILKQQGLVPIDITVLKSSGFTLGRGKVKTKDKILFSRQLSTLINAGLPLLQALRSVNQQTESKPLKIVMNQVISDVEGGSTLNGAMSRHPKVFNQIYLSLIGAGEASGTLDAAIDRLSLQQEKEADLNSKIRGAMTYPVIVLFVMGGVLGFMVVKVLPQVKGLYAGLPGGAAKLPLVTKILLAFSDFVITKWWIVFIIVVVLGIATTKYARTGPGKQVIDTLKMRAPPIGGLFMKVYMARFARTGSTLVASGVPLLQMLGITARSVNNVHIEGSITKAVEKVKGGKSLADSIDKDPNFLSLVPNMLRIGEQSGSMEEMMAKVAEYYEKEVDNEVANISSIIEPVLMVILGVVAFIIVAAVLLPIYGLAGNSSFTGG